MRKHGVARQAPGRHIVAMTRSLPLVFAAMALAGSPALASSSDWFETEGGSVRLVTSGTADEQGRLRGMIDIVLKPGWKTYWRDPGGSGVPPTLDVTRSADLSGVTIDFPAPARHDEGNFVWMGYDRPVAFPVVFETAPGSRGGLIEADLFLGVCETICIPVKAELVLDPAADPDNEDDAAAVEAAFAALPAAARPDFGVSAVSSADGRFTVEVVAPGDPGAVDFFLAGDENYAFGPPEKVVKDGKIVFSMDADIPEGPPASGGLHYTLVGQSGAVSGVIPYF